MYSIDVYTLAEAWGINFMSESDAAQFLKACSVSLVVHHYTQ